MRLPPFAHGEQASHVPEQELLDAARRGDEDAFGRLVEPYRGKLHAHCYRMLASVHDAEDALQEALLRAWRGLHGFDNRRAFRSWLYKIATNTCLDAIARRPKRALPGDYGPPVGPDVHEAEEPLPESVWVEPYPDEQLRLEDGYASPEARYEQREAVELAFIAALQHLSGRQRAVLLLREVLGFSAKEVAEALDSTPASVNSALQRARKAIDERLPQESQQATMRSLGDERLREVVQRFIDAFENGEVDAILAMLAEDVTFAMPPYASWYRGRDAIADSWLMPGGPPPRLRYVPTRANGQLALGTYHLDREAGRFVPIALDVLTLHGTRIADITVFRTPDVFRRFGLPEELPFQGGQGNDQGSPATIAVRPVGTVESPLVDLASAPKQGHEGAPDAWLVFEPAVRPALDGIRPGDRVVVLTWLARADRGVLRVHPRDDPANPVQGVFATRSADRPNPIGLHEVEVLSIDGERVHVSALEAIHGTPIIDLKPVLGSAPKARS